MAAVVGVGVRVGSALLWDWTSELELAPRSVAVWERAPWWLAVSASLFLLARILVSWQLLRLRQAWGLRWDLWLVVAPGELSVPSPVPSSESAVSAGFPLVCRQLSVRGLNTLR